MGKRTSKYSKEILTEASKSCTSVSGVLRILSLKMTGGSHRYISGLLKYHKIDTSHFTGKVWSRGLTKDNHPALLKSSTNTRKPDPEFFVKAAYPTSGAKIAKRLLEKGFEYKCKNCGVDSWLGKKLTLHVDHINGDHTDNRLENLRFLCPNCHQQTDTWGNKGPGG